MFELEGFEFQETLFQGELSTVMKGVMLLDRRPVVVKFFNHEYPELRDIARLKKEFEITQKLQGEGIIEAISLEKHHHSIALVVEDFGGQSLTSILKEGPLTITEVLLVATSVVKAIGRIHDSNIIHKDINPSNILWNRESNQIKVIDFGISTALSKEVTALKSAHELEGTLAYISPEQTGRMNRVIDYRTDFYSLGALLYELAAGIRPFTTEDAMDMIDCHISKEPEPAHQHNADLPPVISDIFGKLMAKNAEDRYQSSEGILVDLERCQKELEETGTLGRFEIAQSDFSKELQIPQKLYGRAKEVYKLLSVFDESIQNNSQLLLISGNSGVGKSALVNEIHKPIVARRGNFIFGKFEQLNRNIPYAALVQAIQDLTRQLLTVSENELLDWRKHILDVVDGNGQVLIEIVPELVHVIGKQPELEKLPTEQNKNRFLTVLLRFFEAISRDIHPLVMFIDDLQWADSASMELLTEILTSSRINNLLVIGAYRDNEISSEHLLHEMVKSVENKGVVVENVNIQPLTIEDVSHLTADTLRCEPCTCGSLSSLIYNKTLGNPFFVNQFLLMLKNDALLSFDVKKVAWQWDIDNIKALNVTNNVVELLTKKVNVLPEKTKKALKLGAAIGHRFTLKWLSLLYRESLEVTLQAISPAIDEGLIIPANNDYLHLIQDESLFSFQHDKVLYSCYELIDVNEKNELHLQIGRILLEQLSEEELKDNAFMIVNHINLGIDLVDDRKEKYKYANLNLIVGKEAKNSNAYIQSLDYLNKGIKFLEEDSWNQKYTLTLDLYTNAASVAYLSHQYKMQQAYAELVIKHSKSPLDRLAIDEIQISACMAQYQFSNAIEYMIDGLDKQGIELNGKPGKLSVLAKLLKCKRVMSGYSIEQLESLPAMSDQGIQGCMAILLKTGAALLTTAPNLSALIILERVLLSIKYGNAPTSAASYASYALVHCSILNKMNVANKFAKLALNLSKNESAKSYRCRTHMIIYLLVYHWSHPLKDTYDPLLKAYHIGIETGDWECASISIMGRFSHMLMGGINLDRVMKDIAKYDDSLNEMDQVRHIYTLNIQRQMADKLMTPSEAPTQLKGKFYSGVPDTLKADMQLDVFFWSGKIFLCFLMGDYKQGETYITKNDDAASFMRGFHVGAWSLFYSILTLLMLAIVSEKNYAKKLLKRALKLNKKIELYCQHAPQNFSHKLELIVALIAQVKNKPLEAEKHFNKAIELANSNQFTHEEAIANQLAAEFHYSLGRKELGGLLMNEALYLFGRWGAQSKCNQLEIQFGYILKEAVFEDNSKNEIDGSLPTLSTLSVTSTLIKTSTVNHGATTATANNSLDLTSVMKAAQAISGEIVLPRLIEKIMTVVFESAGAQVGYLIKVSEQEMLVYSQIEQSESDDSESDDAESDKSEIVDIDRIPLENFKHAPHSIINFVARTKEMIIIKNAKLNSQFGNDPYISKNEVKSVLCYPLINQGTLTGILYLENNLMVGAFTAQRLELLEMISSQLAVSIDNADLYTRLEGLVTELRAVNENLEEIVDDKTRDIRSILEAIQQGILAIDDDNGTIGPEHSKYLEELTGCEEITGQVFYELLFKNSTFTQDEESQMMSVINATVGQDEIGFAMNSHLLPREATIKNRDDETQQKVYELDWNPIYKNNTVVKILLVVRDVTELRALELASEQQRQEIKIIQEIINVPTDTFFSMIASCYRFINENREIISQQTIFELDSVQHLFRNMHTMKGLARSYRLKMLAEASHIAEQFYSQAIESKQWDATLMLTQLDNTQKIIDNYQQVNLEKLGRQLDNNDNLIIDRKTVEDNLALLSSAEFIELFDLTAEEKAKVATLRHSFSRLIQSSIEEVLAEQVKGSASIAKQLEKAEPLFIFDDPGVSINNEAHELLNNVFTHLIRNSIDHGLELPHERINAGKPEQGKITLLLEIKDFQLQIKYSDDGRGLNLPAIYQSAIKKGIIEENDNITPEFVANLIYSSGFSTAKQVSDISGRGVGMDAVKNFLENKNCSIEIALEDPTMKELTYTPVEFIITLPPEFFSLLKNVA